MVDVVGVIVPVLFGLMGLAILAWIAAVFRELPENAPSMYKMITRITGPLFNAAPAQYDIKQTNPPIRFVVGRIIPIIFWLLIILPMVIFPIILIVMPLLGIPWTYLLPPTP